MFLGKIPEFSANVDGSPDLGECLPIFFALSKPKIRANRQICWLFKSHAVIDFENAVASPRLKSCPEFKIRRPQIILEVGRFCRKGLSCVHRTGR